MGRSSLIFAALSVLVVSFFSRLSAFGEGDSQFPHREKFPQCVPITTERFLEIFDEAIVIDARNNVEFDVIQVLGAKNPSSGKMKKPDLLKLRGLTDTAPMVFYCNGCYLLEELQSICQGHCLGFRKCIHV